MCLWNATLGHMHACMYTCVYVCVHVCMYAYSHGSETQRPNFLRIANMRCDNVCMYVFIYVCMHVCVFLTNSQYALRQCMYVCMYLFIYVCMYVYFLRIARMYVCMYMSRYTRIQHAHFHTYKYANTCEYIYICCTYLYVKHTHRDMPMQRHYFMNMHHTVQAIMRLFEHVFMYVCMYQFEHVC
jgi:hypothetical protein